MVGIKGGRAGDIGEIGARVRVKVGKGRREG